MIGGITSVVTLLKPKNWNLGETKEPEDEQLHVLLNLAPAYSSEKVRGLGIGKKHALFFLSQKNRLNFLLILRKKSKYQKMSIVILYKYLFISIPF